MKSKLEILNFLEEWNNSEPERLIIKPSNETQARHDAEWSDLLVFTLDDHNSIDWVLKKHAEIKKHKIGTVNLQHTILHGLLPPCNYNQATTIEHTFPIFHTLYIQGDFYKLDNSNVELNEISYIGDNTEYVLDFSSPAVFTILDKDESIFDSYIMAVDTVNRASPLMMQDIQEIHYPSDLISVELETNNKSTA